MSIVWRTFRYWLYIIHRWLGIAACLLFAMWFVSGLVMTLVGFPELDEDARRAGLRDIAWRDVAISPAQLLAALPLERYPRELTLEMQLDAPVYRVRDWDGSHRVISARRLASLEELAAGDAEQVAATYARAPAKWIATIERDQWTVPEGYIALRPLHKFAVDDADGTQVYVSAVTGQVVLATTRTQRFWNWLGAVPHWIYFTAVRENQPLWRQINLWASGPAIFVAVSGIWIGVLRLRIRARYANGAASPYHGWKRWHHWVGIIGGLFLFTWILSGWLSVNPNQWLSGSWPTTDQWLAHAGQRSLTHPANLTALARPGVKQATFYYVDQRALVRLRGSGFDTVVDAVTGQRAVLNREALFASVTRAMPGHPLVEREVITRDDLYWYSHHGARPLPILRAVFGDPAQSWFYIHPATGQIVDFSDSGSRRYRWWFNALHRWDFSWLLQHRALWYASVWCFALLGLVLSVSGVVIGWRRVRRKFVGTGARV